jgi:hypothetical protein
MQPQARYTHGDRHILVGILTGGGVVGSGGGDGVIGAGGGGATQVPVGYVSCSWYIPRLP